MPLGVESHLPAKLTSHRLMGAETKRMVKRYVVCKMAIVLLAPFSCPIEPKIVKTNDWVGMKSPKRCQGEGRCLLRPIAVLDGKERQALRTFSARKSRLPAHARDSSTCTTRNARMLLISLLKPIVSWPLHSRFHSWA